MGGVILNADGFRYDRSLWNYCSSQCVEELTVIHYGNSSYDPMRILPIRNVGWVKPRGGFWTSPVDSEWGWKDWCTENEFRECNEENSIRMKFNPDARILVLDSLFDLKRLPFSSSPFVPMLFPDYEELAKSCDAIWLTENGESESRMSYPVSLYGWDCESILIMNAACCYNVSI